MRNLALFVYKAFQLRTKVINNAVVFLGPQGGGSGDCGGCLGWVVQALLVVRLGLWRVCLGFLVFGVRWSGCGLFSREALVFWGVVGHFLCFSGGLWVLVSPLMLWLCYWGAYLGACAAGLWLLRLFVDFLLGGFGMIKTTQIIQFAIYPHKVGNADAKCHEVKFSNKCCFFVRFFLSFVNMYSRILIILLMLCL